MHASAALLIISAAVRALLNPRRYITDAAASYETFEKDKISGGPAQEAEYCTSPGLIEILLGGGRIY